MRINESMLALVFLPLVFWKIKLYYGYNNMLNFIKNISQTELIIIIVLILLFFFGSKVVRGLAKTGGETVKEIKKVKKTFTEAVEGEEK